MTDEPRAVDAEHESNFLLARAEKRALRAIALRLAHRILLRELAALEPAAPRRR